VKGLWWNRSPRYRSAGSAGPARPFLEPGIRSLCYRIDYGGYARNGKKLFFLPHALIYTPDPVIAKAVLADVRADEVIVAYRSRAAEVRLRVRLDDPETRGIPEALRDHVIRELSPDILRIGRCDRRRSIEVRVRLRRERIVDIQACPREIAASFRHRRNAGQRHHRRVFAIFLDPEQKEGLVLSVVDMWDPDGASDHAQTDRAYALQRWRESPDSPRTAEFQQRSR